MNEAMDNLMTAVTEWGDCKASYDKAYDEYEGVSWSWHGAGIIEALDNARQGLAGAIEALIDQRITLKLKALEGETDESDKT